MNSHVKVLGMGALALALSPGMPGVTIVAHAQQQEDMRDGTTSAAMHNAAYDEGLANAFTSAETIGEMLECSAIWQRWSGVLESSGDPAFGAGLREELSAANANNRHRYWQRQTRRDMRQDSDVSYFDKMRGKADIWADGCHEGFDLTVKAGGHTEPVLEAAEHVLDDIAPALDLPIVLDVRRTIGLGGDDRRGAALARLGAP